MLRRPLPLAIVVFLVAEALFLIGLTVPHQFVFDEVHYVPAARALLTLDGPVNIEHPLLGKWLIAQGIRLFGDDTLGWRFMSTLAGAVTAPGDITAAAEFNVLHHPEAARLALKYPATKTLVPLDASQRTMLTFEQFHRLNLTDDTRCGHLLRQLIPFALRAHHQHLGVEGMWLPGVTALASIARPRLFQRATMAIDVETHGKLTRGMTIFDRRTKPEWRNNIDVLQDVEPQGVLDYLTSIVLRSVAGH